MVKISIISVRCPEYVSEDGDLINCLVRSSHIKGEYPFTAYRYDCEDHGREIWHRCNSEEFGPVKPYEAEASLSVDDSIFQLPEEYNEFARFLDKVNEENSKKSFLSMGILWASKLDYLMSELLDAYFNINPSKKKSYKTLNDKVDACGDLNLGIFPSSMKRRFDNIRVVRNKLAHEWDLSIKDRKFKEALKDLYEQDHSATFEFIEDLDFLLQMILSGSCSIAAMEIKNKIEYFKSKV
ncbi:hypothetical protein [Bacterioplanoides sp. SCSIO 12839]|uniref:hypothetical protein n=1 Tax=Bacterioplanoides sp. SCSIO 12839 TaxID=2829569 RepID=UPI0021036E95|nr:hypothetical protein [Bacterioplanoides sp. SCSIO 12839]UTW48663.1 hypothetical protein KFF03_01800 [Bacterioplanoides sp. SCSIO 12839]